MGRPRKGAVYMLAGFLPTFPHLLSVARGKVYFFGDLLLQFLPWREFAREAVLSGKLPLWNPFSFCGQPFLANLQSALLYPLNWLLLPLPPDLSLHLSTALHASLAGLGALLLARGAGLSPLPSLFSSLAYSLGGFFVTKTQFTSMFSALAWTPWALFAALLAGRSWRPVPVLSVTLALCFLAGHAQIALLTGMIAVAFAALHGWRGALRAGLGCLLSLPIAAAQLAPTSELLARSPRTAMSLAEAMRFSLPPWQAPSTLAFGAFGHPSWGGYFGVGNYWETCFYLGPVALALAVAAPMGTRLARFALGLAVVGFLLSLGRYLLPLQKALWAVLPPVRLFHDPARFLLFCALGASLLVGLGAERLVGGDERTFRRAGWLLIGAGAFSVVTMATCHLLASTAPETAVRLTEALLDAARLDYKPSLLQEYARYLVFLPVAKAFSVAMLFCLLGLFGLRAMAKRAPVVMVAVLVADLLYHAIIAYPAVPLGELRAVFRSPASVSAARGPLVGRYAVDRERLREFLASRMGYVHYPLRPERAVREVVSSLAPNVNILLGIPCVGGYDPLRPRRATEALELAEELLLRHGDAGPLKALGARWLVVPDVKSGRPEVCPLPGGRPFYTVGKFAVARSFEEFERLLLEGRLDLTREAVLNRRPPILPEGGASHVEATWLGDGARFSVETQKPTLLVTGISAYPGWRAFVDGREARPLVADWCLIALPISRGRHRVRLIFHAGSFSVGLYVSLLSLAALLGWLIATSRPFRFWTPHKRRRPS